MPAECASGFCLSRLEVLNWGTFDKQVWVLPTGGQKALLTGDIGSGKPTLVDAVTALLVPPRRITFNKAAGAQGRERSLKSYIRGEYKSVQTEQMNARAKALREDHQYAVILAQFHHGVLSQTVTLAQVLWISEGRHAQFFLIVDQPLTIAAALSGREGSVTDLKKAWKRLPGFEVFDNFKPYALAFRKRMGIRHEKALELFNQTISMKSVGNLTSFVREHMLEPGHMLERIERLKRDFDNLNQAHTAVLKARNQIEMLAPLQKIAKEHRQLQQQFDELTRCRDILDVWIATQKIILLDRQQQTLEKQQRQKQANLHSIQHKLTELRTQESQLRHSIDEQGGRRIVELQALMERLQEERKRKQREAERYREVVRLLDLPMAADANIFHQNREAAMALSNPLEEALSALNQQQVDATIATREMHQQCTILEQEITSLRQRKNNIPYKSLQIRASMIDALKLREEDVPFIGELLQVVEREAAWEGALERLLHNFGLSMLVPDELYTNISDYVEKTNLRGRLVYFRVRDQQFSWQDPAVASVLSKLVIQQNSVFRHWLQAQLHQRFPHVCCDSMEDFRHHPFAISRAGQIKAGGTRHEKDDRNKLFDRSRFVLGWNNQAKIEVLTRELTTLQLQGRKHVDQLARLGEQKSVLEAKKIAVHDLLQIEQHTVIDWPSVAQRWQQAQNEKQQIERGSDVLRALQQQLQSVQTAIAGQDAKKSKNNCSLGELQRSLQELTEQRQTASEQASREPEDIRQQWFARIAQQAQRVLGDKQLMLRSLDRQHSEIRQAIQVQINTRSQKMTRRKDLLIKGMADYKHKYPTETSELDVSLQAWSEYATMLSALKRDDLPKHEQRFKQMLHEGTIQGIVLLRTQLEKEQKSIRDKIADINRSLQNIQYDQGSYIRLQANAVHDADIREFEAQLRQCISGSLAADDLYNEQRFLQVKGLVDHFNEDPYWARRVTDVRNWFRFSAIELWCEDDSEKEFYSDSAGKSGGQKEKLAYTILASSLAYQFGASTANDKIRSFRFVVIDEAFGRGSDESTRYALRLFATLGLQLLIVTPLQKIHIIADYVKSVHLVHNEDGRNSVIRSVTIEEYRKERARRLSENRESTSDKQTLI